MPRLKRLSGDEVIKILEKFGFQVHSQRGDHVKMRRVTNKGKETLTIPKHKQLDTGTCRTILRQASRYIILSELEKYFYS
ncbi:MAG: type II toxin-antitoxin system HicA family toxin [Cyanobacteria bacterium P01_G01_bin.49]